MPVYKSIDHYFFSDYFFDYGCYTYSFCFSFYISFCWLFKYKMQCSYLCVDDGWLSGADLHDDPPGFYFLLQYMVYIAAIVHFCSAFFPFSTI